MIHSTLPCDMMNISLPEVQLLLNIEPQLGPKELWSSKPKIEDYNWYNIAKSLTKNQEICFYFQAYENYDKLSSVLCVMKAPNMQNWATSCRGQKGIILRITQNSSYLGTNGTYQSPQFDKYSLQASRFEAWALALAHRVNHAHSFQIF